MTADPIAATVELLKGRPAVTAIVAAEDVFGEELPDDPTFIAAMPKAAVSVQSSGGVGPGDASYLKLGGQRVDVNAYASTVYLARKLARVIHAELKAVRRELVTYTDDDGDPTAVLIHGYLVSGGNTALREPFTSWPRVIRSYVAIYAEQEVAA